MFAKLAFRNVKRQVKNYLLYFVTVSLTIALMFSICCMTYCDEVQRISDESDNFAAGLIFACVFVAIATAFVLRYATSFMLRLRRKEFGMYLTLGMTRKNILSIFSSETCILYTAALGTGLLAGVFLYQGLMALLASLLEIELTVSAYPMEGLILTVILAAGMFLISTFTSVRYLKKVHIAELLQTEVQEKGEEHPLRWAIISLFALAGIVWTSIQEFDAIRDMFSDPMGANGANMVFLLPVLGFFIFLFHMSCARSLMGVLLRRKKLCANGTNTFIFRQLSGKMRVNSVMVGVLSVLFLFSFLLANLSFSIKASNIKFLDRETPFDVLARFEMSEEHPISIEEGTKIISKYNEITNMQHYGTWTNGEGTLRERVPMCANDTWTDTYIPLSEFNGLLTLLGMETLPDDGGYYIMSRFTGVTDEFFKDFPLTLNHNTYSFRSVENKYPFFTYQYFYVVVPDAAIAGMEQVDDHMAYCLAKPKGYDVQAMHKELSYLRTYDYGESSVCDFELRELHREWYYSQSGIIIIALLFISTVFVCMALAILSLKTLSNLQEDKQRYLALHRLGANNTLQRKTLFCQTFGFFSLPYLVPLLMSIPFAAFCCILYRQQGFPEMTSSAMISAVVIALSISVIYGLYFMITYRIAKNNVLNRQ